MLKERDQHAHAGDLAEFGEAAVGGRQERGEAHRGRDRGERERAARLERGAAQRRAQLGMIVPLGAVAHGKLDAEVDAEPDEQHEERNRDHVEGADQREARGGRNGEPGEQADRACEDDAERAQREPQDDEHGEQGERRVELGVVFDRAELIVLHGNTAGQAHLRLIIALEVEVGGKLHDRFGRRMAGLERGEVEHRRDQQKAAHLVGRGRLAAREHAPGEGRRATVDHVVRGVGAGVHHARHVVELEFAALDAGEREPERVEHAAQAGIRGERAEEGIRAR